MNLSETSDEKAFYCNDGTVLKSIPALADKFEVMSKELYTYHVTAEKNDFANWVRHVFEEEKLATRLSKAKTPTTAAKILRSSLTDKPAKRQTSKPPKKKAHTPLQKYLSGFVKRYNLF